ncbi:MAG: hypothetical protein M3436_05790 [Pseudomonadota bacterium]|nr:hypothetical protein [Pseudomonadota bacterium]
MVRASHQTGWTGLIAKLLMPRKLRQEVVVSEAESSGEAERRRRPVTTAATRDPFGLVGYRANSMPNSPYVESGD